MSLEIWAAFVAASAILIAMPGPTVITVIGYALTQGRYSSIFLVAAVVLGTATGVAASLLGLGTLLATSAFWFTVVKWLGGLYLLYLGFRMLRSGVSPAKTGHAGAKSSRTRLFANTYLVTALNPKGIVFLVAFLPQFVNPAGDVSRQLIILALTFITLSALSATMYVTFAGSARNALASPGAQRGFNIAGGSMLLGAGAWVLFAKRLS